MHQNIKTKIVLFSGGTGNTRFVNLVNKLPNVELSILVNGYDDGKSTGEIRKYIPGMLGPSDFRKNISHLIDRNTFNGIIFYKIMNYRFPKNITQKNFKFFLELNKNNKIVKDLDIYTLSYEKFIKIKNFLDIFLSYFSKKNSLNLSDISLGNILIAATYLKNDNNFNKALFEIQDFLEIKNKVINITNGENLYLNALLEDGNLILSEEALVQLPHKSKVENIFLLKEKLTKKKSELIASENKASKAKFLQNRAVYPLINPEAETIINSSDIIIYGPGTQFSSLFPSYLTRGLGNLIEKSKATKFLITNIFLDNDIINENVESIISKFYFFFNKKYNSKNKTKLVDYYLLNKLNDNNIYL